MPMLRLIPTTDTATLAWGAMEDTDMVLATAVDTPPLDTPDLDTLVLVTAVVTLDSATEVTPVWEVTTARLRPRLIPTTDTDTPDLATLA